jgi:hypothetical protein
MLLFVNGAIQRLLLSLSGAWRGNISARIVGISCSFALQPAPDALCFANICPQRNLWKQPNNKWKVIVVDGLHFKRNGRTTSTGIRTPQGNQLRHSVGQLVSVHFFTVPTLQLRMLYVFVILSPKSQSNKIEYSLPITVPPFD